MKKRKFLSVGYGNVGQAIPERCESLGLSQSDYLIKSAGIYHRDPKGNIKLISSQKDFWQLEEVLQDVEVAFLTIPSFADGKRAYQIIEALLAKNVMVVTSEKGALANFYPRLESKLDRLGISATVGGGTRMMEYLSERMNPRVNQIHAVLNGTLNFVMHGIAEGGTAGQIIDQAVTLGYAEPGANDHLEVINGEAIGDIPKKTAILWNTIVRPHLEPIKFIKVDDLSTGTSSPEALDQAGLNRLISEAQGRRYIVSMVKADQEIPEDDVIAGFRSELASGWVISGGFRRTSDNPLFKVLKLPGPGNGAVITGGPNESDGVYNLSGPGAGPGPTAAAMVQDAARLLKIA